MTIQSGLYLLLAAGFSRRFGGAKQSHLLPNNESILHTAIKTLQASTCDFVVVIRNDDTNTESLLEPLNVNVIKVMNAHFGLSSVIAEATNKLNLSNIKWIGISLGDMPYIKESTFLSLTNHITPNTIVRPRYQSQLGHPVLFGCHFFNALKEIEGDHGAKVVIQTHEMALNMVDVEDPMVLHDIDKIQDIIPTQ